MSILRTVRTICTTPPGCHNGCGIIALIDDGRVVEIHGDPSNPFYGSGNACLMPRMSVTHAVFGGFMVADCSQYFPQRYDACPSGLAPDMSTHHTCITLTEADYGRYSQFGKMPEELDPCGLITIGD